MHLAFDSSVAQVGYIGEHGHDQANTIDEVLYTVPDGEKGDLVSGSLREVAVKDLVQGTCRAVSSEGRLWFSCRTVGFPCFQARHRSVLSAKSATLCSGTIILLRR